MMRENSFLTLGSPLIDIIANVDDQFLNKYSLKSNNAISAKESHNELFYDLTKLKPKYQAGGCALNTARTVQWVLKTKKMCTVLGAVGKDNYCEILKKQLDEEGVGYLFEENDGEETGKCAVLLNGENRSLCTDLGASKYFHIKHLKSKHVWNVVEQADYYYAPGFFLGVCLECLIEVAQHSLDAGKTFLFNLSAPFLTEIYNDELNALLPLVDILFGNEAEARAFAKTSNFMSDDLTEILLYINNSRKANSNKNRTTVITRGASPVCLVQNNRVREYPVTKLLQNQIVDTSAAGDAFVGGFIAELMLKKSVEDCVLRGICAAGKIVQKVGCSF